MSDSKSKTILTLMAGALVGGAIGVAAGMLLAPDKGSETRKRVKDKLDDLAEDFNDKVDEIVNQFGDVVEEAQEVVEEKVSSTKKKMKKEKA